MGYAHLDEVVERTRAYEGLRSTWQDLGTAAGSRALGLCRIRVPAGERSTPAHVHGAEEELFYVLAGSGLSWQDGETYEVRAGDCLVHHPGGAAHTLRAGPDGLDVLAFGERLPAELCLLPRPGVGWLGPSWVAAPAGEHPFEQEAAAGELAFPEPSPRPPGIVNVADVAPLRRHGASVARERRDLGRAVGSIRTGLKHYTVVPGMLAAPPHAHSAEEELFVVLGGSGTLEIAGEEHGVRTGHVVAIPPGHAVVHAVRAGRDGLEWLAYGNRVPDDVCWYPRSRKIFLRGLDVMLAVPDPQPDYWDGED